MTEARHETRAHRFDDEGEMIRAVRAGNLAVYDTLYLRHARPALRFARQWSKSEADAEDLRAEAFLRTLSAIRNGAGPSAAFRPYLFATIKHIAEGWARRDRLVRPVADIETLASPRQAFDEHLLQTEIRLAGRAFATLPERWQTVLRSGLLNECRLADTAKSLGINAGAAASLAYRAREGLRQAYLQLHITRVAATSCKPCAENLGAYVRGAVGRRRDAEIRRHLNRCAACRSLEEMLRVLNEMLGGDRRHSRLVGDDDDASAGRFPKARSRTRSYASRCRRETFARRLRHAARNVLCTDCG